MGDKSVRLEVRVWYDEKTRHIKLAGKGLTASTVSNDPGSVRYHPNLYGKLSKVLRRLPLGARPAAARQPSRHGSGIEVGGLAAHGARVKPARLNS